MTTLYKIFVYGTLKQNEHYHDFLKEARLLACDSVTVNACFKMQQFRFDSDDGALSPGVREGGDAFIIGEVYEVDQGLLDKLDELEEMDVLFTRKQVEIKDVGLAWMYSLINEEIPYVGEENNVHFLENRNAYSWQSIPNSASSTSF